MSGVCVKRASNINAQMFGFGSQTHTHTIVARTCILFSITMDRGDRSKHVRDLERKKNTWDN